MNKNKKIKSKNILFVAFTLILISTVIYIIIFFVRTYRDKKVDDETKKVFDNIVVKKEEGKSERILKLEELQKINSDIVGWITIDGTEINYPVLQTTNNSYYMTHNYKKEYYANGSIFLDKDYNWELPSSNLLIYGHNNNNNTMFQGLLNYKDKNYYIEHPNIKFTTNTDDAEYEIIAVFYSKVYYKNEENVFRYYYFINAEDESEFNSYVKNSIKASIYNIGKTAKYGDQLLTLSTCSYHTEDGRFVIVARKSLL